MWINGVLMSDKSVVGPFCWVFCFSRQASEVSVCTCKTYAVGIQSPTSRLILATLDLCKITI